MAPGRDTGYDLYRSDARGALAARQFYDFARSVQLDIWHKLFLLWGIAVGLPLSVRIRRPRRHLRSFLARHGNRALHCHTLLAYRAGWWGLAAPPSQVNVPQN